MSKYDIKKAYKAVIIDLKAGAEPKCKEYYFGCANCQLHRLIEDLEDYFYQQVADSIVE